MAQLPFLIWCLIVLLIVVCICFAVTIVVAIQDIKETKQNAQTYKQKKIEKQNAEKSVAKQIGAISEKDGQEAKENQEIIVKKQQEKLATEKQENAPQEQPANEQPAKKTLTKKNPQTKSEEKQEVKKATKKPTQKTETKEEKTMAKKEEVKKPVKKTTATKPEKKVAKKSEEGTKTDRYTLSFDKEAKDWVLRKDGTERAIRRFPTKQEAIKFVKPFFKGREANLVIRGKDGKFDKLK